MGVFAAILCDILPAQSGNGLLCTLHLREKQKKRNTIASSSEGMRISDTLRFREMSDPVST
jgi:hypothetical protein